MSQTEQCRHIWRTVFGDSEEFINLYFSRRYPSAQTFTSEQDGVTVAQGQCFVYSMTAAPGAPMLKIGYVSGLATMPDYRNLGHAARVMRQIHCWMYKHHIDYSLLIPASQDAAQWYTAIFGYQPSAARCKRLATASQIAACTQLPQLSPHIIYTMQHHLASLPYAVQHRADDLRDQMDVCLMSGGGLYQTAEGHYFMAERISDTQYHLLDTTANGNSPIPHLGKVTTPLLFLPICSRTPLPGELHVSMMLD